MIEEASAVLRRGGLVAFATETVYGLGAVATDPDSVARIFAAKGRPSYNPLIVHVADLDQARDLVGDWPENAQRLANVFWPGPLTLVLPKSAKIPTAVTAGRQTVGLRMPEPPVARELIRSVGLPIAAPSANRSNRISPTRAEHVLADLDGRIDLILDSGPAAVGLESTVVDLTNPTHPTILRPGPISKPMLEAVIGPIFERAEAEKIGPSESGFASPGQLPIHYAPRTRAIRIEPGESLADLPLSGRIALLELGRTSDVVDSRGVASRVRLDTPGEAARQLYEVLHRFDALAVDLIVVLMPPNLPEWSAVRDRLERATAPFRT